jgi:hypothetical protein
MPLTCLWSLKGSHNRKPHDRCQRIPLFSSCGWETGLLLVQGCRVWHRQVDWAGHPTGLAIPQLHMNKPQTMQNTVEPQQPLTSTTLSHRPSSDCHLPALLSPVMGPRRRSQMPCHHFNKGKLKNQHLWVAAVAVLSKKPAQPWLGGGSPRDQCLEAPQEAQEGKELTGYPAENNNYWPDCFSLSGRGPLCAFPAL